MEFKPHTSSLNSGGRISSPPLLGEKDGKKNGWEVKKITMLSTQEKVSEKSNIKNLIQKGWRNRDYSNQGPREAFGLGLNSYPRAINSFIGHTGICPV